MELNHPLRIFSPPLSPFKLPVHKPPVFPGCLGHSPNGTPARLVKPFPGHTISGVRVHLRGRISFFMGWIICRIVPHGGDRWNRTTNFRFKAGCFAVKLCPYDPAPDEPPMTASGGNFIGGEIARNKQYPHEADLRRLRARKHRIGAGAVFPCCRLSRGCSPTYSKCRPGWGCGLFSGFPHHAMLIHTPRSCAAGRNRTGPVGVQTII